MIPILFQKDELNFTSNGLGRLVDMVDCEVSEELNGPYEIEFQYPIGGALFDYMIKNGGVVYSTHDDAGDFQAFDIDGHTTPIDGLVTFRGKHISYRLNKYVINPFTASSCAAAMAAIKPNSQPANMQFSFWTDKSVNGNFELTHPVSARAILGGAEGSILDVYGKGDYKFNNFNVMLYANRGIDSGVTIRYGKNLLDLNREYDASETYTAIAPYWEKEGVTVYVPGLYVLSPNNVQTEDLPWTDQDGNPILGTDGEPIYFRAAKIEPIPMDFTDAFEEAPTPEVLAQKALEYLDRNKPWLPNENIEIDFVALWQTPEYENVAALQRLSLGDKASVYYPEVNLVCEHQKIIKTVYGPLEEKYKRMEFGNLKSGLGETIIDNETNTIAAIVNSVIQNTPALQAAITHATELIRGGLGGHVVLKTNAQGEPEELLIMDTDDVATAVNVWRFNQGGLGHSHSGYNGPYDDVALTMDGRINANMITTGILNAVLIKAGVLSDGAGRNFWNMETGEFSLQNYPTKSEAQDYASDAVDSQTQQDVFNKLTNNGQTQGIYLQNGKIYINGTYIQAGTISGNYISGGSIAAGPGSGGTNALYIYGYDSIRGQYVLWGVAGGSTGVASSDLLAFRARGYALSNFASNGGISENSQMATIKLGAIYGDTQLPSWNGKLEINCEREPSSHPGHSGSSNQRLTSIIMNDGKIMCLYELYSESHETGGIILNGALPKNALPLPSSTGMYYMSIGDYSILDNSYRAGRISARDSSFDGYYLSIDNGSGTMLAGFYANAVSFAKEVDVNNDLIVSGTKNRVVKTEDYGSRLFYSYETSSPMFGDVGEGKTDENGVCYVFIDPVVAESVNGKYYVFIQEYGPDRLWVDSVENAFFVINGAPNTKFSWEIKAKQRGYENMRMERPEIKYTLQDTSYDVSLELENDVAENAAEFYERIISGRI